MVLAMRGIHTSGGSKYESSRSFELRNNDDDWRAGPTEQPMTERSRDTVALFRRTANGDELCVIELGHAQQFGDDITVHMYKSHWYVLTLTHCAQLRR